MMVSNQELDEALLSRVSLSCTDLVQSSNEKAKKMHTKIASFLAATAIALSLGVAAAPTAAASEAPVSPTPTGSIAICVPIWLGSVTWLVCL